MKKNSLIPSFQFLRTLCVISVFLSHIPNLMISSGQIGVSLFMALSGFFVMKSSENKERKIFIRKLIKIVPLYWILTILLFIFNLIKPNMLNFTESTSINLIKSLFFIPYYVNGAGHKPIINVGWYLNIEIMFTLIFTIINKINNKYRGQIMITIISIIFILGNFIDNFVFNIYSSFYILYYIMGIVCYYVYVFFEKKNIIYKFKYIWVLMAMIYISLMVRFEYNFMYLVILFFYFCLVCLYRKNIYPRITINIGNYSFAFYLIHYFIIALVDRTIYKFVDFNIISIFIIVTIFFLIYIFSMIVTKILNLLEKIIYNFFESKCGEEL